MRSRGRGVEPARLEAVQRRFEVWRRTRQGRARIPGRLWKSAVGLAATYGLCRTARTLGLDYNALKRHVESAGLTASRPGPRPTRKMGTRSAPTDGDFGSTRCDPQPAHRAPAMAFVELPPLERFGAPECIVELEHPHGAKMRIRLTGQQSSEVVAAVSQAFFGAGS
jgi:hypothetical protein